MAQARRYELDLSEDVLIAIGSVSAQWATLEYYLARATLGCEERFGNPVSKLFSKTAFRERRLAFYEALTYSNVSAEFQQAGTELVDRIVLAEDKRHVIIHGMVNEYSTPDGILPSDAPNLLILREHPKHWFAERLSVAQIVATANEIAEINWDLIVFYLRLYQAVSRQ